MARRRMRERSGRSRRRDRALQGEKEVLQRDAGAPHGDDGVRQGADGARHDESGPKCPLCGRPIPPDAKQSLHHLVPKLRGGRHGPTVRLHQICHNEIHATLSETELARRYNTMDALRTHPRLARFIAWVAGKDPRFHSRTVGGRRKRPAQR